MHEMTIRITPERLIQDIQDEFSRVFPFLKIEFLRKPHPFLNSTDNTHALPTESIVRHSDPGTTQNSIEITPSMTVRELEECCEKNFGLFIQFYRKSASLWLEITMTDNWTMKQQNDRGCEISTLFNNQ